MGWAKGQSGNPGGRRKKDYRIKDLAQVHTDTVIARLVAIAKQSTDLRAAVSACTALLDRGFGKPAQSVDLTNSDRSLAELFAGAVAAANGIMMEAEEQADSDRSIN